MRFTETPLPGAWVIDLDPRFDDRGFFARTFSEEEFSAHGLPVRWPHCNASQNLRKGTLRGMHGVKPGCEEAKLVRCVRGAVHDVIVDLRPGSPTRLRSYSVELSAAQGRSLFVPSGFLHGFQTLEDDAEVDYMMSTPYRSEAAFGARWDDPLMNIAWPLENPILSPRDLTHPLLSAETA